MNWSARGNVLNQYLRNTSIGTTVTPLPSSENDVRGPFHLMYTPPYGREFPRGFEKAISEGLCASASFDLSVFSEG
jgi:hypothetical protein